MAPRVSLIARNSPNRHLILWVAVILFSMLMLTPIGHPVLWSYTICFCDLDLVPIAFRTFPVHCGLRHLDSITPPLGLFLFIITVAYM